MRRRKIGRRAPLLTLGTIAATGVIMAGCDSPPPDDAVYSTPTECAQSGVDPQICEAEYQRAYQENLQNAPRFSDQAACEEQFGEGRCQSIPAGVMAGNGGTGGNEGGGSGSFFVPFMTGYLISSAIGSLSNYGAYRNYTSGGGYSSTPIYRGRDGGLLTTATEGGQRVTRSANVNTRTVSRSGFGGRTASRGFFGG